MIRTLMVAMIAAALALGVSTALADDEQPRRSTVWTPEVLARLRGNAFYSWHHGGIKTTVDNVPAPQPRPRVAPPIPRTVVSFDVPIWRTLGSHDRRALLYPHGYR